MMTVPSANRLTVTERDDGRRIDNYLLKVLKDVPKSHVYKLLRSGQVRVNGSRAKPHEKLATGDEVRVPPALIGATDKPAAPRIGKAVLEDIAAAVLVETPDFLAVNKPSGIAVHKGSGLPWGLIDALRELYPQHETLELVHRIDRETSGVVLVATSPTGLKELGAQFRKHTVAKHYVALVAGRWSGGRRRLQDHVERAYTDRDQKMVVGEEGKLASAWFTPSRRYRNATLMEVELETGRTHQIRVQANAAGHPLAGDVRYGDERFNEVMAKMGLKRLFLHAKRLEIQMGAERHRVEAPLPTALTSLLGALEPLDGSAP